MRCGERVSGRKLANGAPFRSEVFFFLLDNILLHRLFVRVCVRAAWVRDLHATRPPVAVSTADSCMISRGPNGYGRSHHAAERREKMWAKERVDHVSNGLINLAAIAKERLSKAVAWLSRRVFLWHCR